MDKTSSSLDLLESELVTDGGRRTSMNSLIIEVTWTAGLFAVLS